MKWQMSLWSLMVLAAPGLAQDVPYGTAVPDGPGAFAGTPDGHMAVAGGASRGYESSGDNEFPNFIGFVSNPTFNLDPRALTQLWPVFGSTWTSAFPPLNGADFQAYGAGLSVALSDRLVIGVNRGAYAAAHLGGIDRFDRFPGLADRVRFQGGEREGWLDLGFFGQYTLIRDVPDQFLLSAGLQVVAPTGSSAVFEGTGPAELAPYFTAGKELGDWHVLLTSGYQFPCGSDSQSLHLFYGDLHIDRRVCCWFYPLVEFNGAYLEKQIDLTRTTRRGFFDEGGIAFGATGNILVISPGFNLVLVPNRLEIGAVYQTPIASQHGFNFNGVLVKAVVRF